MGKVLELSDETYHQLADLAQQQRTPEEMLRVCLATYEAALYERVHCAWPTRSTWRAP